MEKPSAAHFESSHAKISPTSASFATLVTSQLSTLMAPKAGGILEQAMPILRDFIAFNFT